MNDEIHFLRVNLPGYFRSYNTYAHIELQTQNQNESTNISEYCIFKNKVLKVVF